MQVKKLLKDEKDPHKQEVLDIRQKALKLTANSIYGCLGFQSSRFYAQVLHALPRHPVQEVVPARAQAWVYVYERPCIITNCGFCFAHFGTLSQCCPLMMSSQLSQEEVTVNDEMCVEPWG